MKKKKKKGQEGILAAVGLRIRPLRWRALGLACGGRVSACIWIYSSIAGSRSRVERGIRMLSGISMRHQARSLIC